MSRIRGFRPPPDTPPVEARLARLVLDNGRMRRALTRAVIAAGAGERCSTLEGMRSALALVLKHAREGLERPMA